MICTETQNDIILSKTKHWIEKAVIGLNLCPFAKAVYVKQRIKYVISSSETLEVLISELMAECQYLDTTPDETIDTTLIIIQPHLSELLNIDNFYAFNDFTETLNDELWVQGYEGIFQWATFHPAFQFEGTDRDDPQNNTNRSPYPIFHLLRESSIDKATDAMFDASVIYEANIKRMQTLGNIEYQRLML